MMFAARILPRSSGCSRLSLSECSSTYASAQLSFGRHRSFRATRTLSDASDTIKTSPRPDADGGTEVAAVNRIDALMELEKFSRNSNLQRRKVARLRGIGYWSDLQLGRTQAASSPAEDSGPTTIKTEKAPPTRRMQDSYVEYDVPIASDKSLHEVYVGGINTIRLGRLMEDFDTLAGSIAYKHVLPDGANPADASKYGLYLVTAAVDRLDMLRPLSMTTPEDLRLSGHVSYTSTSSMEVFVKMSSLPSNSSTSSPLSKPETILIGRFTMACRSSLTGKKHPIPQLLIDENDKDEVELWKLGKEMRARKKEYVGKSLERTPPDQKEVEMMHNLFMGRSELYDPNSAASPNVVFMRDTRLTSCMMMHPQERNIHNKIFGGYLMRLAHETAFSTACLFAQGPTSCLALDEITFSRPVEIGSLLLLTSEVSYSPLAGSHKSFQVSVEAETVNLTTSERTHTNTFHFTFAAREPINRRVLPKTYQEAMRWLESKRRREVGASIRKAYGIGS